MAVTATDYAALFVPVVPVPSPPSYSPPSRPPPLPPPAPEYLEGLDNGVASAVMAILMINVLTVGWTSLRAPPRPSRTAASKALGAGLKMLKVLPNPAGGISLPASPPASPPEDGGQLGAGVFSSPERGETGGRQGGKEGEAAAVAQADAPATAVPAAIPAAVPAAAPPAAAPAALPATISAAAPDAVTDTVTDTVLAVVPGATITPDADAPAATPDERPWWFTQNHWSCDVEGKGCERPSEEAHSGKQVRCWARGDEYMACEVCYRSGAVLHMDQLTLIEPLGARADAQPVVPEGGKNGTSWSSGVLAKLKEVKDGTEGKEGKQGIEKGEEGERGGDPKSPAAISRNVAREHTLLGWSAVPHCRWRYTSWLHEWPHPDLSYPIPSHPFPS